MVGTVKFKINNNHNQHQLNTRVLRHIFPFSHLLYSYTCQCLWNRVLISTQCLSEY